MQKIIIFGLVILCTFGITGCEQSQSQNERVSQDELINLVKDVPAPTIEEENSEEQMSTTTSSTQEEEKIAEKEDAGDTSNEEAIEDVALNDIPQENYINNQEEIVYNEDLDNSWDSNSSNLTAQSGVNYYGGRTETYYSSNVLYHYRTNEWTVDDEGFYKTDDGYYVVAASDMPQGTTFEGSKGTCIVLDNGCAEGITDYYVNW